MNVGYAVVGLLVITNCARVEREKSTREPPTVATQPGAPQPVAKPAAPVTPLASAIVSSREAIWRLLADPKAFATLEA